MSTEEIVSKFRAVDVSTYPDFYNLKTPLERGLWVLWVAKDELSINRMSPDQIASVIIEVMEIDSNELSIKRAFNRADDKVHAYRENDILAYGILRPGKDYLKTHIKGEKAFNCCYFKPNTPFSSKLELSQEILSKLTGELRIVDPYCDKGTLSILRKYTNNGIKFVTRLENIKPETKRRSFLTDLSDFCREFTNVQFKNYPNDDIHDRYIISSNALVLIGHSLKDIGSTRESLAIFAEKSQLPDIYKSVLESFDSKWGISLEIL